MGRAEGTPAPEGLIPRRGGRRGVGLIPPPLGLTIAAGMIGPRLRVGADAPAPAAPRETLKGRCSL